MSKINIWTHFRMSIRWNIRQWDDQILDAQTVEMKITKYFKLFDCKFGLNEITGISLRKWNHIRSRYFQCDVHSYRIKCFIFHNGIFIRNRMQGVGICILQVYIWVWGMMYDSYSVVKLQMGVFLRSRRTANNFLIEFPKALERKAFHLGSRNTSQLRLVQAKMRFLWLQFVWNACG